MNDFVEECRREWKRLGVPDPIANEMAADLAADIAEAEAEGASAETVVGSGAFDPRSFARAWAAERGLVGQAPATGGRWKLWAALAFCAALVFVGAVLVLLTPAPSVQARLAVGAPFTRSFHFRAGAPPGVGPRFVVPPMASVAPPPLARIDAVRSSVTTVGVVLLAAGLVGIALVAALGVGRRRPKAY